MITEKVNTEFVELSGKKFQKEKNERQIKKEMVNSEFVWVVGRVALKERKKERKKETDSEHRIRLSCRASSSKV